MLPAPLQDPTMLMEVSEATWRRVFDAAGETERLAGQTFKHKDVQESLNKDPPGPDLYNALDLLHDLGTDNGRSHIDLVAQDLQLVLPVSSERTAPREFVAQLWVAGKLNSLISDLLERAQFTQPSTDSGRTYREFVGDGAATTTGRVPIDKDQLKETISNWCRENGKSDIVSITTRDYNGEWYCHIIRGDAVKRVPEVHAKKVRVLEYQAAASDLLRYDPKTGRIGIATRSSQLLNAYRATLGKLIADNDQLFSGANICSLCALQERRKELFESNRVLGIARVDVVQLLWRRGDRDKFWISGRDCFQILDDLQAKLVEGELIEACFKIEFTGGGRPANVTLKVPSIIHIRGPNEQLVEQLLDATGLRGSFDEEGARKNFWSQRPWKFKQSEWRRRLGADFDRLVAGGLLRPGTFESVEHPDHPEAGRALDVIDIEPGVAVGVSDDPFIGVRSLTSSDVEAYELQILPLAKAVQLDLSLQGEARELTPGSGLWHLGSRTFGPNMKMSVFLAVREPGSVTTALIQSAANGDTPLLLYPQCCRGIEGMASVSCRIPQGPFRSLLEEAVRSLKWDKQIPLSEWSAADLLIDMARGVISYRRIELSTIKPDTHPFKFAAIVASANGKLVSTSEINKKLTSSLDNDAAKKAKLGFWKAVKTAYKNAGLAAPTDDIFESKRGGYCLKATAIVHP